MMIADIIGYTAAGIGTIMFLPQVIRCYRTKHTKDISFLSYALLATTSALWTTYGFLMSAYPIIFVNIVVLLLSVFLLGLKRKYG